MAKKVKKKYANGFSISVNAVDARILCTLSSPVIEGGKDTGKISIEDVADIRMSPVMLKQLAAILVESVKKYEDKNGEIKLPMSEEANG